MGQLQAIFDQRTNAMLRDYEVGIVNGVKCDNTPAFRRHRPRLMPTPNIAKARIDALKAAKSKDFDMKKLVRICDELNSNWTVGNYLSIASLLRMMLDHHLHEQIARRDVLPEAPQIDLRFPVDLTCLRKCLKRLA